MNMPSFIEVSSTKGLGSLTQDVDIKLELRGSRNSYTSKKTGEVVNTSNMWLEVIE